MGSLTIIIGTQCPVCIRIVANKLKHMQKEHPEELVNIIDEEGMNYYDEY